MEISFVLHKQLILTLSINLTLLIQTQPVISTAELVCRPDTPKITVCKTRRRPLRHPRPRQGICTPALPAPFCARVLIPSIRAESRTVCVRHRPVTEHCRGQRAAEEVEWGNAAFFGGAAEEAEALEGRG